MTSKGQAGQTRPARGDRLRPAFDLLRAPRRRLHTPCSARIARLAVSQNPAGLLARAPGIRHPAYSRSGHCFAAAPVVMRDRCFETAEGKSGHLLAWRLVVFSVVEQRAFKWPRADRGGRFVVRSVPTAGGATSSVHAGSSADVHDDALVAAPLLRDAAIGAIAAPPCKPARSCASRGSTGRRGKRSPYPRQRSRPSCRPCTARSNR